MAIGDRIRAWREARANGQTPILDALGIGQQQATQPQRTSGGGGQGGDPAVRQLQQQLAAAGFNPGPIDGIMGPQTRAAMQARDAAAMPMPRPNPERTPPASPPMPRPRPEQPVPLPRPRPAPIGFGMGSPAAAQAPMDYRIPIAAGQPDRIAAPAPGTLTQGQLTPVDYRPPGWLPVPPPGPVPTTQEWTTRGRNPGPIGAPDGDPDAAAIYGQPGLTSSQRSQYASEREFQRTMGPQASPPPPAPTFDERFAPLALPPAPTFDERFAPLAIPPEQQPYTPPNLANMQALLGNLGAPAPQNLNPREMARLGQLLRVRRDDAATMPPGFVPPRNLGNLAPGV